MEVQPFRVEVERRGPVVVVRPVGELDLATVDELDHAVAEAGRAPRLVLDLSELEFLDTSGMRFLLKKQAECAADGCDLNLVKGSREVERLFAVAGFADRLPFVDTVEEALPSSADG